MIRSSSVRAPTVCAPALLLALLVSACATDDVATSSPLPTEPAPASSGFRFSTGPFEIQPGDTFECFYTSTITDKQLNVRSATGRQGPGGHHITVYYTDQKVPVGHHECTDVEMIGLHQIAGANDGNEGIIGLPEGYATVVPAGKQLVVQAHYIRTEPGPATVEDVVDLQTLEANEVKAFANSFVLVDGGFKVPPRGEATSVSDCVVPKDLDLLLLLGHMHEWGSRYKLERIDEATNKPVEMLYETAWEPLFTSHPPVTSYDPQKPLHLPKGTRLRQTCTWKNTESNELQFPREMCVMFSYYFPDDGFLQCDTTEVKP